MKMMGLFSIFDPISCLFSNWVSFVFPLLCLVMTGMLFVHSFRVDMVIFNVTHQLLNEMKSVTGNKKESFLIISLSLMMLILFSNFLGVFSFVFTSTAHLSATLSLGLPIWLVAVYVSVFKNINQFLTHLTPMSTPLVLMFFMVCIESVSLIIRPVTLSVRLAANMIAGHLLLTLLGNIYMSIKKYMVFLIMLSDFLLMILETAVAGIQSYVFVVLSLLYINESF